MTSDPPRSRPTDVTGFIPPTAEAVCATCGKRAGGPAHALRFNDGHLFKPREEADAVAAAREALLGENGVRGLVMIKPLGGEYRPAVDPRKVDALIAAAQAATAPTTGAGGSPAPFESPEMDPAVDQGETDAFIDAAMGGAGGEALEAALREVLDALDESHGGRFEVYPGRMMTAYAEARALAPSAQEGGE